MVVDHPFEQLLAFATQRLVDTTRPVLEQSAGLAHFLAHLGPVAHRDPDVAENFMDLLLEQADLLSIRLLVDREANE